ANFLYSKAAQDGTALGSVSRNIPNFAFMKNANANFDPLKFSWIGSPEMTHRGCFVRTDSGVTAPEHLFEREVLMGGDGAGTSLSEMPILLRNLLGMKFKVVDGYKGSTDIVLAMQRNEVHGLCQTVMAFAQAGQHMLDDGTVKMLFTTEKDRVAKYDNKVPTIFEYAKTEEQRNILAFHASSLETWKARMLRCSSVLAYSNMVGTLLSYFATRSFSVVNSILTVPSSSMCCPACANAITVWQRPCTSLRCMASTISVEPL